MDILNTESTADRTYYRYTAPGGYTEFIDIDLIWRSPDNSIRWDGICMKMHKEFTSACRAAGFDPSPALKLEGYLRDAGFQDIESHKFHLPLGPWALDPRLVSLTGDPFIPGQTDCLPLEGDGPLQRDLVRD